MEDMKKLHGMGAIDDKTMREMEDEFDRLQRGDLSEDEFLRNRGVAPPEPGCGKGGNKPVVRRMDRKKKRKAQRAARRAQRA